MNVSVSLVSFDMLKYILCLCKVCPILKYRGLRNETTESQVKDILCV